MEELPPDVFIESHVRELEPSLIPRGWIEKEGLGQCLIRRALAKISLEGFVIGALKEYAVNRFLRIITHSAWRA